jgi:hypothetical protein
VAGLGSEKVVLAQGRRSCAKHHYYLNPKIRRCIMAHGKGKRYTYRELNRGLVSGIERLEKIEELGEK